MVMFERNPQEYADRYIYDKKQRVSRNMAYGSMLADGLESDEATGDPLLDLMMAKLPKYELMDKPLEADLPDGKESIRLLAKPDTAKADYTAFDEYKTSVRKWTQKMADESAQITFYATVIWLAKKIKPEDIKIRLINVPLEYQEDGSLAPTGEDPIVLPTKRTLVDVIRMTNRARNAWSGIKELCIKELL